MRGGRITEYNINEHAEYNYVAGKICYSTLKKLYEKLDELQNSGCYIYYVSVGYCEMVENERYYLVDGFYCDNTGEYIDYKMKYRSFKIIFKPNEA